MNATKKRLTLTRRLRDELKKPLGDVIKDINELPKNETIICVGDVACDRAINAGYNPLVCVYDNKCKRQEITPLQSIRDYAATEVEIENPAGELASAAFTLIREAVESGQTTKICVEGEEDLLALAAIREAGDGWFVLYGQPDEGLVAVKVDDNVRDKVEEILDEMRNPDED